MPDTIPPAFDIPDNIRSPKEFQVEQVAPATGEASDPQATISTVCSVVKSLSQPMQFIYPMSEDDAPFKKLSIRFHKDYSKLNYEVRTGDPTSLLLLGTYSKFEDHQSGEIMDFNDIQTGDEDAVKAWDGELLHLDKILVHRDVVIAALEESVMIPENEAESVDPKNQKAEVINLQDFFKKLFSESALRENKTLSFRPYFHIRQP